MKKTGLKRLQMEADECNQNLEWLNKRKSIAFGRAAARIDSDIRAQERKMAGLVEKANNYGKGNVIWLLTVEDRTNGKLLKIYYADVVEEELELLLNRDLKGLEYKVLAKNNIKTGQIFQ